MNESHSAKTFSGDKNGRIKEVTIRASGILTNAGISFLLKIGQNLKKPNILAKTKAPAIR
jgi:hypothetical protein